MYSPNFFANVFFDRWNVFPVKPSFVEGLEEFSFCDFGNISGIPLHERIYGEPRRVALVQDSAERYHSVC